MSAARKHVLIAGLSRFVSTAYETGPKLGVQKTNKQMVFDDIEKAKAAGYECSSMDVNPDQPEESLKQLKEFLQRRRYDLFIVGAGLRTNPALAPLFKEVVNTFVGLSPKTKLGFAPLLNEMFQTIARVLAE